MTKEEIVKQVKDIIVDKLGVEESEVTETASFTTTWVPTPWTPSNF